MKYAGCVHPLLVNELRKLVWNNATQVLSKYLHLFYYSLMEEEEDKLSSIYSLPAAAACLDFCWAICNKNLVESSLCQS